MKTKKIIAVFLIVGIFLSMGTFVSAATAFAGGSGTEEDPYLIANATQLDGVRQQLSAWYKLTANISLPENWAPIGKDASAPFTGNFNGNGYAVSGLRITDVNSFGGYVGVFGCNEGTIRDLTVEDGTLDVRAANNESIIYMGGVAGYNKGTVQGCVSNISLNAAGLHSYAGGIAGYNTGTVADCGNAGRVTSRRNGGGIVGRNEGTVEDCLNRAAIDAMFAGGITGYNMGGSLRKCLNVGNTTGNCVGGIAAGNKGGTVAVCYNTASHEGIWQGGGIIGDNSGDVWDCFNTGTVTGGWNIGGIVGEHKDGAVKTCYSVGTVDGDFAGGIIGYYIEGTVNGCYYLDIGAQNQKGSALGTAVSAEELLLKETYEGFDLETVWETGRTEAYPYPTLRENLWFEYVGIRMRKLPRKTDYPIRYQGTPDLTDAVLEAVYSNGYGEKIPLTGEMVSGFDASQMGTVELTVTAGEETTAFSVTIREPKVHALEIVTMPKKTVYLAGEPLDPAGLTVRAYYDNGENAMVTDYEVIADTATVGEQPLTVTCGGKTAVAVVTVRPAFPFTDVANDWAYKGIEYCYRYGIMNGTGETTFAPKLEMSRAMVVTALYRLSGAPEGAAKADFTDLVRETWYTDAVDWAAEIGLVKGVDEQKHFAPDRTITRVELVTLLYRYGEYCGEDVSARAELSAFTDGEEVPEWAKAGTEWAVAASLIQGAPVDGGLAIDPYGVTTREQAATLLMRYLEYFS